MNVRIAPATLLVPIALLTSACSGGGISVDIRGPSVSTLPADEPVTVIGVLATNNGLVVNDTVYDTGAAVVRVNGSDASSEDLDRGNKVFVAGRIAPFGVTGSADVVVHDADLVGRVEAIDAGSRHIVALGQRVVIDDHTAVGSAIDLTTLDGLSVGDRVSISGFRTADGALAATRVDRDTTMSGDQVVGRISSLDEGDMSFEVHGLPVDYRGAGLIELPTGAPTVGMTIVASGTLIDGVMVADALRAASVPLPGRFNERVIVRGIVTRVSQDSRVFLGDIEVRVDIDTAYTNGDRHDLAVDARLFVDGRIDADGRTILVDAVRFDH